MSVPSDSHAEVPSPKPADRADLGDAALRAKAEPAIWTGNVLPFGRPKRERSVNAPAIVVAEEDRPAPSQANAGRLRLAGFLAGSLLLHAGLYALFARSPTPLASVGLEAMNVELVLGADMAAGLAPQPSESEAQPSAPERPADTQPTEAIVEPPAARAEAPPPEKPPESEPQTPPEPSPEAKTETATLPEPDPVPAEQAEPAPVAPAELPSPAPPPPEAAPKPPPTPAVAKPKPPVQQDRARAERPVKPKPQAERGDGRGRQTATASPAAASSGIGRGRSDADTNYPGLVAAHLARHKRFPEEARARGEHGVATVRFSLDGAGRVSSVALVRASGAQSLDREAQDVVRRASPFPAPPGGRPISFTLPVRFSLM